METIGMPEVLIVLVIVILLFGVGRISKIGGELGGGIRAFREGLRGEEPPISSLDESASTPQPLELPDQAGETTHMAPLVQGVSQTEGNHDSHA